MVKLQTGDIDNFSRDNLQGQIDHRDGVERVSRSDAYNRGYATGEQAELAKEWFKKQRSSTLAPLI